MKITLPDCTLRQLSNNHSPRYWRHQENIFSSAYISRSYNRLPNWAKRSFSFTAIFPHTGDLLSWWRQGWFGDLTEYMEDLGVDDNNLDLWAGDFTWPGSLGDACEESVSKVRGYIYLTSWAITLILGFRVTVYSSRRNFFQCRRWGWHFCPHSNKWPIVTLIFLKTTEICATMIILLNQSPCHDLITVTG